MIAAFSGWNDAGDAASAALTFIGESLGATRFARLDPEEFYDFQSTRPTSALTEDRQREITWPGIEIFAARVPRAPRDLILVQGPEPSMRWRTFSENLIDLAEALGTQLVVTMGALLADVPHTLPISITGLASDEALVEKLAVRETTYEGPTGIVGVFHTACMQAGMPSGQPLGGRSALRRGRAQPESGARARAQDREPRRRHRRCERARDRDRGVRAPGRPRGAVRSRRAGVRRAPRAGCRA